MSLTYLPENTHVTFELQGTLPILRERYVSPQAGTVVLKGLFNQTAHIETPDGTLYRMRSPKKDSQYLNHIFYSIIRLSDKTEILRLRTPMNLQKGSVPRLRYTTLLDEQQYVFKQVSPGLRGFELWDGMEMQKLISRKPGNSLIADLTVQAPVPTLLILLFPWLDNQTIMYKQK